MTVGYVKRAILAICGAIISEVEWLTVDQNYRCIVFSVSYTMLNATGQLQLRHVCISCEH